MQEELMLMTQEVLLNSVLHQLIVISDFVERTDNKAITRKGRFTLSFFEEEKMEDMLEFLKNPVVAEIPITQYLTGRINRLKGR